jgi:hypothetical protein
LLVGVRKPFRQPSNLFRELVDQTLHEHLCIGLRLRWRVFAQRLTDRSDDLRAGGFLAVQPVQQVAQLSNGDTAQPLELEQVWGEPRTVPSVLPISDTLTGRLFVATALYKLGPMVSGVVATLKG